MNLPKLILLTPYSGPKEILFETINSIISQLARNDNWIIVLDNQDIEECRNLEKKYEQLIFLNYFGPRGAGNCRNMGLDYISEKQKKEFLLLPFDGDDRIVDGGINFLKKKLQSEKYNIVSFAHTKIWSDQTKRFVGYNGVFNIENLLKRYITPCGSTVLKIEQPFILKNLRFGTRFRANDALFFFQAVKYFGKFQCYPDLFLEYKIGNSNSLSGKKFKMIYYKFMAFRDFGLSRYEAFYYTFLFLILGIRRHFLKQSI